MWHSTRVGHSKSRKHGFKKVIWPVANRDASKPKHNSNKRRTRRKPSTTTQRSTTAYNDLPPSRDRIDNFIYYQEEEEHQVESSLNTGEEGKQYNNHLESEEENDEENIKLLSASLFPRQSQNQSVRPLFLHTFLSKIPLLIAVVFCT